MLIPYIVIEALWLFSHEITEFSGQRRDLPVSPNSAAPAFADFGDSGAVTHTRITESRANS